MRRTSEDAGVEPASEAQHEAVRADTPAARTDSLSPNAVPVSEVPPTSVTGTVPSRFLAGPLLWLSGHSQVAIISGLVAVTSLATALVVSQGARQLDTQPRQGTTPYLAVPPSGPVRAPEAEPTAGTGDAPAVGGGQDDRRERVAPDKAKPPTARGRREAASRRPPPQRRTPQGRTPEGKSPQESGRPPEKARPGIPAPDDRCRARIRARALGRCAFRTPRPPGWGGLPAVPLLR